MGMSDNEAFKKSKLTYKDIDKCIDCMFKENFGCIGAWACGRYDRRVKMKVKCIKKDYEPYKGITVGETYEVVYANNYFYWIINNYGEKGMYSRRKFEVAK